MRREAFSLIETIFVIVIISIIAATGALSVRPHRVENDSRWVLMQIKKARFEGLGVDHRSFGSGEIDDPSDLGCIVLDRDWIAANSRKGGARYEMKAELVGELAGKKICFDHLGRASEGNYSNLLHSTASLIVSYGERNRTIVIFPESGYAIIKHH